MKVRLGNRISRLRYWIWRAKCFVAGVDELDDGSESIAANQWPDRWLLKAQLWLWGETR